MTLLQNRQASPTCPPDTSDFEGAGDCGTVMKKKNWYRQPNYLETDLTQCHFVM